jgi:hypothetical protein
MLTKLPPLKTLVASVARVSQTAFSAPGVAKAFSLFMSAQSPKLEILRLDGFSVPCGHYGLLSRPLSPIQLPVESWLLPGVRVLVFCCLGIRSSVLAESLVSAGVTGLEVFVVTRSRPWRRRHNKWQLSPTPAAMQTLIRQNPQLQCLVLEDQAPLCLDLQRVLVTYCPKIALVGFGIWLVLVRSQLDQDLDRISLCGGGRLRIGGRESNWLKRLVLRIVHSSIDDRLVPYIPSALLRPRWFPSNWGP